MRCDGYLSNLSETKKVKVICYNCSKEVDLKCPYLHHANCVTERNRKEVLKVDVEIEDYEER